MKHAIAILSVVTFAGTLTAKEPARKASSSVPGQYPSIIQIAPPGSSVTKTTGLIQSELDGRAMQFLKEASQGGLDRIALVELAKRRSSSEQIKTVADALASTQEIESKELARLADAKHVALPTTASTRLADELEALSGAKFEKAWVERLITINESGVAAFDAGAKAPDPDIRSFAEKMLPVAKSRLEIANRLGGRSTPTKPAPPSAEATPGEKPAEKKATPDAR